MSLLLYLLTPFFMLSDWLGRTFIGEQIDDEQCLDEDSDQ